MIDQRQYIDEQMINIEISNRKICTIQTDIQFVFNEDKILIFKTKNR